MNTVRKIDATATRLQMAETGFYLDREAAGCMNTTMIWYHKYVGELVAWLETAGVTDPADITPDHLRGLLVYQKELGRSETSIHHYASAAKIFLNYCVADGILVASPMDKVRMPRLPKNVLPAFEAEDVRKLLAACRNVRDRAIVLVLLDTGCRVAEFVRLTVGDVDVRAGTVRVWQGKGRKDRLTFLGAKSRKALHKYLSTRPGVKPDAALFASENTGEGLTIIGVQAMLHKLGERAGVANCSPHTFRRSFALWSLRAGMNVHVLAKIMGHSNLETLRHYLALVEQDLAEAHKQHGAVDHML